ncbi:hypothetical protein A3L04_09920 [Thermococcus chitonophagus]|uniref:Uncharacterized protein n=1 Tax=Thermococcus chitonophagus TaxID=54262 RepID=A0A160VTC8_9EURY|nr:hypothetical protein [Thermococcus chitonophagus]ASJ17364.1 hypothetical protein A3L04_09920 [Thermococcus chitonophagus]CUX77999.1 hypothetical protein CHITON_1220 [Thermococcus chitonophagus]
MKVKYIIPLIPAMVAFTYGSYLVRWIFAIITAAILFVYSLEDVEIPAKFRFKPEVNMDDEIRRLSNIVKRTERSNTARRIVVDHILEAYHNMGYEYSDLRKNPPEALRLLKDESNFLERLERSLEILEEEVK